MNDYAIVFTTINVPNVLHSYYENVSQYGYLQNTLFVIVGDHKTPDDDVNKLCDTFRPKGMQVVYLDVTEQHSMLRDPVYRDVIGMLSWNSDVRRNIGYLFAAAQGAGVIISIDDDNYAIPEVDFIGGHGIVGTKPDCGTVHSANNWLNVCRLLDFGQNQVIYPRGFPPSKMYEDTWEWGMPNDKTIVANSGLWKQAPDVDAITNILLRPRSNGLFFSTAGLVLDQDTWCPLNSQNTSFLRSALPAFFFLPQRFPYEKMRVDRYGDIWMGFFFERVAQHFGDKVAYGNPVVAHIRNKHNYLADMAAECGGMMLNEYVSQWFTEVPISSDADSYGLAYLELIKGISQRAQDVLPDETAEYFKELVGCAEIWCEACDKVL